MDNVLEDFGDPVPGEGDEDDQSNNPGFGTSTCFLARCVAGLVLGVDGHECHCPPCTKGSCYCTTDNGSEEDMSVVLGNINNSLQHHNRKRNPRNPAYEADNVEDGEHQEHNSGSVLLSPEVKDRGPDTEDDLEDSSDPDNLLREFAYHGEVQEGEYECDGQNVGHQDNSKAVESDCVVAAASTRGDYITF